MIKYRYYFSHFSPYFVQTFLPFSLLNLAFCAMVSSMLIWRLFDGKLLSRDFDLPRLLSPSKAADSSCTRALCVC